VIEHASGQENFYIAAVLCRNQDQSSVRDKIVDMLKQKKEIAHIAEDTAIFPSDEIFFESTVVISNTEKPLAVSQIQLLYKNVRKASRGVATDATSVG